MLINLIWTWNSDNQRSFYNIICVIYRFEFEVIWGNIIGHISLHDLHRLSLCHSATKIGNFTIRQFSNRQKPIGKLTKRQSYKSATLPFGKSTIKQRGHSATLPNGNLTIRQLNKIANLLFGNFFNILAASKNVVEDLDSRWKWSAQDIRSSAQNKRSKTEIIRSQIFH